MKFGWIVSHLGCFGSVREVIELSNALVEHGHEVTIHHPAGTPCQWLPCKAEVKGLEYIEGYDLLLMASEWHRSDYELLLTSDAKMKGVVVMGFAPSPSMKNMLIDWPHTPPDGTDIFAQCLHNPELYIFADGAWQLGWLKENIKPEAKIGIGLGGINSRMFVPGKENIRAVTIGASGDPRDRKGTKDVVKAASIVIDKHPNLSLRLYWGTPSQDKLVQFLQETTIFLDGHSRAGWCNPVLEAMACGAAVVCTDIGATDFVVDGLNGRRVQVGDYRAMADAALWLLGDENRVRRIHYNARNTAELLDYRIIAARLIMFMEGHC